MVLPANTLATFLDNYLNDSKTKTNAEITSDFADACSPGYLEAQCVAKGFVTSLTHFIAAQAEQYRAYLSKEHQIKKS